MRSLKIPREQILGKKLTELFPGIEKSVFFEAGQRVLKSRMPTSVIDAHRFEDGRVGWFETHIYPVLEGIMYVATDITERKRMEEQLVISQRLATIGELAAMVGHDLRNPLQGMMGILYLVRQALKSPGAGGKREVAELLGTLDKQIDYMAKIVADLQDYARPLTPKLEETSLPDLIRDTLSTMKVPENVKVSVQVKKTIGKVMVDPSLMRRMLTNLTMNAFQAMPKGGRLTIRADKTRDVTVIAVEDTGVGIPEEDMGKLFKPFFTTKAKGQGLGLAVCKRFVEAHGGTITVESKLGKGTTFIVKIPLVGCN